MRIWGTAELRGRNRMPLVAVGCFFAVSFLYGQSEDPLEIWTDTSGRELEARILHRGNGVVVMSRADGKEFEIPLLRFSEESRERISAWEPPPFKDLAPDEAVLVLEAEEGVGSGFLLQEDGRVWVYTNRHVIGDSLELTATDVLGNEIQLGELEIVEDQDLARFSTHLRRGLKLGEPPRTGQSVVVFGNSQGTGVITRSEGEVLGLSADSIEVSSEIVSGNSGGPVLDHRNGVIGVSTFVTTEWRGDPTVEGTRYTEPRRFALRLDQQTEFSPIARWRYAESYERFSEERDRFDEAYSLFISILSEPTQKVIPGDFRNREVSEIADEHNDDVESIPDTVDSYSRLGRVLHRIKGKLLESMEETLEIGQQSMRSMEIMTEEGGEASWMGYEADRRKDILARWERTFERAEEYLD